MNRAQTVDRIELTGIHNKNFWGGYREYWNQYLNNWPIL